MNGQQILTFVSLSASLLVLFLTAAGGSLFSGFTIRMSWMWSVLAALGVVAEIAVMSPLLSIPQPLQGFVQYAAVVMLLTPPICTLGSRRPGILAWQFFVVLPMILVLLWPAASQLMSSHGRECVTLGGPATTGVLVVILMSLGTGLGTSMSLSACCWIPAVLCSLAPAGGWVASDSWLPLLTPVFLLPAAILALRVVRLRRTQIAQAADQACRADAVWLCFQDLYGLLWATRVQERVNQFAPRERWSVLLTLDGFRRTDGQAVTEADLILPVQTLSWVLQRFADETWLKDQLVCPASAESIQNQNTAPAAQIKQATPMAADHP